MSTLPKDYRAELEAAMTEKNTDKMIEALMGMINDGISSKGEEAIQEILNSNDDRILTDRGMRALTSDELKFYNSLVEVQRSSDPKGAITSIDVVMPETIINNVLDDIEQNHPLLSHIDMQHVNAKIKILYTTSDTNIATWGTLTGKINKEISYGFEELDAGLLKLSCFIPVPNAYLDLGPQYLDRITRIYLYEAMAKGVEKAVVDNLVDNTGPISMIADLDKGTTASGVTTYAKKTAVKLKEITPKGMAPILKALAKTRKGNPRNVLSKGLFMVVNSVDNIDLVRPAMFVQNALGEWVQRTPYQFTVVESEFVPAGEAIFGIDGQYILGIASEAKGTIETSDHYQFLEDARVYRCKLYGNGKPKTNGDFVRVDISELKEATWKVSTVDANPTIPTASKTPSTGS